jgi:PhnB protein
MLSIRNGAKAVDFYKAALNAIELFRLDDTAGGVVARLSVWGRGILGGRRIA